MVLFNFAYFKMQLPSCVLMSVLLMIADGLIVYGPSGPLVAPLGSSVVLLCYVDELLVMEDLEVEWRRTDSGTLVHLYQDGESRPEVQQQDYHDRANFFTDQIQHGNFSLRLDNLRAEDEGRYTCRVYSQQDSGETVVQIKDVERLLVSGSDKSISASVGEDVTLNCSVDSHITPEHIEEVSWKKRVEDKDILVLLFQNNKTFSDSAHERYRDRVEFFTAEIPKGNFSLRLKSVRTEDKGVYMCQVFAGGLSANATVVLERLGFSVLHVMVLILCISASGSALLLCYLIYCRSQNREGSSVQHQMLLVICPNVIMFFAFVFWGVSEGSKNETICCCVHYFLRPLMLFWAVPNVDDFTGNIQQWVLKYGYGVEYVVFTILVFSVLLSDAWEKHLNYAESDKVVVTVLFAIVILSCLCKLIYILFAENGITHGRIIKIFDLVAEITFDVLPTLQFILLFYMFGSGKGGLFIIAAIPVILTSSNDKWFVKWGKIGCSNPVNIIVEVIFISVVNAVMVYLYTFALENETDAVGWACVMGFLQMLWALMKLTNTESSSSRLDCDFHRVVPVYVFGSVGVVLLNSVTLMTELILKTVNGEGAMGDLRITVFSSEFLFALSLRILPVLQPLIRSTRSQQSEQYNVNPRSQQNQDPPNAEASDETRVPRV